MRLERQLRHMRRLQRQSDDTFWLQCVFMLIAIVGLVLLWLFVQSLSIPDTECGARQAESSVAWCVPPEKGRLA